MLYFCCCHHHPRHLHGHLHHHYFIRKMVVEIKQGTKGFPEKERQQKVIKLSYTIIRPHPN